MRLSKNYEAEVSSVEYENMTVGEIQQQLDEMEASRAELERALVIRRQEARHEVVQQVKELILNSGYELDEIIPLVTVRRRRGAGSGRATSSGRDYTRYVDPENAENIYVRGVLPGWMKGKMQEQGYDPSIKADREAFKANYLKVLEA